MKIINKGPYDIETSPLIGTFVMKELRVKFESYSRPVCLIKKYSFAF